MKCDTCGERIRGWKYKVLSNPPKKFCKKCYLVWSKEHMPQDTSNKEKI